MTICYTLCTSPLTLLPVFDAVLVEAQTIIFDQLGNKADQVTLNPFFLHFSAPHSVCKNFLLCDKSGQVEAFVSYKHVFSSILFSIFILLNFSSGHDHLIFLEIWWVLEVGNPGALKSLVRLHTYWYGCILSAKTYHFQLQLVMF